MIVVVSVWQVLGGFSLGARHVMRPHDAKRWHISVIGGSDVFCGRSSDDRCSVAQRRIEKPMKGWIKLLIERSARCKVRRNPLLNVTVGLVSKKDLQSAEPRHRELAWLEFDS